MNGIDAVVFALVDSNVKSVTGVPGFPITELMDAAMEKLRSEWSINEKVALDMALGSSVCGQRSAVITKHVGMNVLADPLVSSTTHTIGAGVVIIAGDDPGIEKSQNEQDSRFYGLVAEVPVFDPDCPQTAYQCIIDAFVLSEKTSAPVIIRITDRMLKTIGDFTRVNASVPTAGFDKKMWHLTMKGKHQRFHKTSYPLMCGYSENSRLNTIARRGKVGIISSGFSSHIVDFVIPDDISHLSLAAVNPLPMELVKSFVQGHERILVVEETEPVIEKQLSGVLGKLTGHMPYGKTEAEDIKNALGNIGRDTVSRDIVPQTIQKRGARPICDNCPYLPLYNAVKETGVPVAGDVGCVILASSPPLSLIDAAYSLGGAISTASGFDRKGIALIGDFGLAHSGINGLVNAVHNRHNVVVVVLQNEVSAMTGGQPVPDLTGLVSSYIRDTQVIDMDGGLPDLKKLLAEKLEKKGISVILARGKCPVY
ncbi:MAG: thiamine pyrophosphate-dependent enzyme [Candidatus Methanoperedens sp.]|jgi:indolepyruvate ferredoxin oxidoreductase alpha subunit|nr:thiamine pyrophosphate-dependent enzyme [Candidatus Methanoperedens sp.]PKL52838.1 MAG: indolepyruvate ferredoxin oxidoreductase [Candidatus Methanoperedenaceae archaeon HGW-Methanoperedenaceae-1]